MSRDGPSRFMQRIDALGPGQGARERILGALGSRSIRPVLDAFAAEAARIVDAPAAAVSVIGRRALRFVGTAGLAPEVAATGAIDRSISFCQFVVRDDAQFEVNDAPADERVPQLGVELFGARSYLASPVRVEGQPIGALCVYDSCPRVFSDEHRQALEKLAERVSLALQQSFDRCAIEAQDFARHYAVSPVFGELRNLLGPLRSGIDQSAASAEEMRAALRALAVEDEQSRSRLRLALAETIEAANDIDDIHAELRSANARLSRSIFALEMFLASPEARVPLFAAIDNAAVIAEHLTKLVGGVSVIMNGSDALAPVVLTPVLAALFSEGARRLCAHESSAGIQLSCAVHEGRITLVLSSAGWNAADLEGCRTLVAPLLDSAAALALTRDSDALRLSLGCDDVG